MSRSGVPQPISTMFGCLAALLSSTILGFSAVSTWSTRSWQSDDGLPNNNVRSVAQTADGFLWVATGSRLARFDGVRFEEFTSRGIIPGMDKKIGALLRARDGSLVFGVDHGPIAIAKNGNLRVITNIPDLTPRTIVEDAGGAIWITAQNGIVCRLKDDSVKSFGAPDGLLPGSVCSLACDDRGTLWFAKGGEVGVFEDERFRPMLTVGNLKAQIASARGGGAWVAAGYQLLRYDESGTRRDFGKFAREHSAEGPTAVLEDRDGAVWIGTSDSGLFCFRDGTFEHVPLSHRQVLALFEDGEGNIWAGTGGGGLVRIQPRVVALETTATGLPFETLESLTEDSDGNVWAATQNGLLICRRGGRWLTVSTNRNWPGGGATCVAADRDGGVWIGTRNRALYRFRDEKFTEWRSADGLRGRAMKALLAASTGDLWIAADSHGFVQRLREGRLETLELPNNEMTISCFAEDNAGRIWMSSSKGALMRVDGSRIVDETDRTVRPARSIRALHAAEDGSLWIGYAGAGVGRLKGGEFGRVTVGQGLFDGYISQIAGDGRGWIWFGADHGIYRVRESDLVAAVCDRSARVFSIRYGPGEGLANLQANFGHSPGAMRTRDGRLWIPMRTGLAIVSPERQRENPDPPAGIVRRVTLDDETITAYATPWAASASANKARIPPGHRRLDFSFTAPTFAAPENVRFRYRLVGEDSGWVDPGEKRTVSYSRLPAGEYLFRLAVCNANGIWNEAAPGFAFTVVPFFWQTGWFQAGLLAAFSFALIVIVRHLSTRRLRLQLQVMERQAALDRERTRIARDIHDDVGSRMTEIVMLNELTLQKAAAQSEAGQRAEQVAVAARNVMKSLDEAVWAINPRNDTVRELVDYLSQFAAMFLKTANVPFELEIPDHPSARTLRAEARHNLFLAAKEALNNVVRHANASRARLVISETSQGLRVVVEDNGRGFSGNPSSSGADGLRNMRQRMDEIGGCCEIESVPGRGTRVSFVYPWRHG